MSVTASDIIALAKTLHGQQHSEAHHRAVVSRAYYAAYHDCYAWHVALPSPGTCGSATQASGVHDQLIASLTNPTVKGQDATKSRMRGYALKALKQMRVCADYRLAETVTDHDALQAIANSENILAI